MAKRVLVVDDEETVLETLAKLIASGGYEVDTRATFQEAKDYLLANAPDILVTDVRLGAFNGLQLALLMRAEHPRCPIVVLSAFDDPLLRQEAALCQAAYLTKPVSKKELLVCLAGLARSTPMTGGSTAVH